MKRAKVCTRCNLKNKTPALIVVPESLTQPDLAAFDAPLVAGDTSASASNLQGF